MPAATAVWTMFFWPVAVVCAGAAAEIEAPARVVTFDDKGDASWRPRKADVTVASPARSGRVVRRKELANEIEAAIREPMARLVQELDLCRRYYEATFPSHPIGRLVFVGGEAHQRRVCQQIAMDLSLAAQVGDPMVRMARSSDLPPDSGLDPSRPQPSWAVALGLTMGATAGAAVPQGAKS